MIQTVIFSIWPSGWLRGKVSKKRQSQKKLPQELLPIVIPLNGQCNFTDALVMTHIETVGGSRESTVHCTLYAVYCKLYTVHYKLCTVHYTILLYTVYCVLQTDTVQCKLCKVHCVLHCTALHCWHSSVCGQRFPEVTAYLALGMLTVLEGGYMTF